MSGISAQARFLALAARHQALQPIQTQSHVQLPLWPEPTRGVPNGFLRSALFGAIGKGKRRYIEREQLAAIEGLQILYTGQRLDQGDFDVYQSVLHTARLMVMGEKCRVTSYYLLKLMGKTDSGKNRRTLHNRLVRLRANAIEIKQGRHTYVGGLIDEAFKDEETHEWIIVINSKLRDLFSPDQFTLIDWAVRQQLDGQPLAQWLHGFYASHARPYPMRIETLKRLCGSEAVLMSDFAKTLRKALGALVEACKAHGQIFGFEVRGDLVSVEKKGSGAQQRHLAKKAKTPRKKCV